MLGSRGGVKGEFWKQESLRPEPRGRHAAPQSPQNHRALVTAPIPFCGPHKLPNVLGRQPSDMQTTPPRDSPPPSPCTPTLPQPRNGLKFFVSPSVGISGWENAITVNFTERGTRIETARLFSRKHKFLYRICKISPQWGQVHFKWRQLWRGDADTQVLPAQVNHMPPGSLAGPQAREVRSYVAADLPLGQRPSSAQHRAWEWAACRSSSESLTGH